MADLWVTTLGEVPYPDAIALQQRLRDARQADAIPDALLLLEHPPVYTRGRRTKPGDLPHPDDWYRAKGIDLQDSDRGGQVTFHAPGQLVGYPIMRIASVRDYVATMEQAMIAALREEGIEATTPAGLTGVWTNDAKIGSIGVHVSRGVTTHGFAINVANDLTPFQWIHPCGIDNAQVTSISLEQNRPASMSCFRKRIAHHFANSFGLRQRLVSANRVIRTSTAVFAGGDDRERTIRNGGPFAIISPSSHPGP